MARSRGTDPGRQVQDQHVQAQQAYEQAQQRLAYQQAVSDGQPQPAQPAQPPARKKNFFVRHKIITALLVIVAVVAVVQTVSGGTEPTPAPAPGGTSAAPAPEAPAAPGIGTAVADGKFEFTVTSLEPGVPQIGDATFGVAAQGQFLLVHVTVTNVGDAAQYFDSSSQKLLDGQGRTHSADSSAAIYLPDSNSFLTSINPGNTVEGIVVFDIPADATPASIELHDSPFSGGVTVSLT